jgi:formate hydrogenlyase subunit 3/multisubunit Na+/H+ antiporter MnhD subunit
VLYLLLILIPIGGGVLVYVSGRIPWAPHVLTATTVVAGLYLVATIPTQPYTLMPGTAFSLTSLGRIFLFLFFGLVGLILLSGAGTRQGRNLAPAGLTILGLVGGVLTVQDIFVACLLLQATSLTIVFAAVDNPLGLGGDAFRILISAGLKYLTITTFASVCLIIAFVMADRLRLHPDQLTLLKIIGASLAVGFGLRISALPFPFWLADVAEESSPLVTALIVAVINVSSLLFFFEALQLVPVLFSADPAAMQILLAGSVLTSLIGGLLAMGQKDLRRLLAFSTVDSVGFVLFGVATMSAVGVTGAIFAAISLAVLKTLLFVCAASIEHYARKEGGSRDLTGLIARLPVTTLGLVVGALGVIGLPPFSGFVGKLMIYQAAAQLGARWVVVLAVVNCLPLVYYARAVYSLIDRQAEEKAVTIAREPWSVIAVILCLVVAVIALGVYPTPLVQEIGKAVQLYTFLKPG